MSALDYSHAWYGSIDAEGGMQAPGSQNWSVEPREQEGQYKVTIRGHADYQPSVLLTPESNDLSSYGGGMRVFINVSDVGKDAEGNWFFGVTTSTDAGLAPRAFSFLALATDSNEGSA